MEKLLENTKYRRNYFTKPSLLPLYDALVDAISKKEPFLKLDGLLNQATMTDIIETFENVVLDNPQFYYFFKDLYVKIQNNKIKLHYQKEFSDEEEKNIELIMEYLKNETEYMDEYETALFVFEFLTDFCVFDSRALQENAPILYEQLYSSYTMEGVFVNQIACCSGVASAYLYILTRLGLESYIARASLPSSENKRIEHAYNVVIINGVKVNVDITLSMREKNRYFKRGDENVYFTTHIGFGVSSQDLINMGYRLYQDQVNDISADVNEHYSYFVRNNLVFGGFPQLRTAIFSMCNRHKIFECRYDGNFDGNKLADNISTINQIVLKSEKLCQQGRFVMLMGGTLYEN